MIPSLNDSLKSGSNHVSLLKKISDKLPGIKFTLFIVNTKDRYFKYPEQFPIDQNVEFLETAIRSSINTIIDSFHSPDLPAALSNRISKPEYYFLD